jgi:hypothetical protein
MSLFGGREYWQRSFNQGETYIQSEPGRCKALSRGTFPEIRYWRSRFAGFFTASKDSLAARTGGIYRHHSSLALKNGTRMRGGIKTPFSICGTPKSHTGNPKSQPTPTIHHPQTTTPRNQLPHSSLLVNARSIPPRIIPLLSHTLPTPLLIMALPSILWRRNVPSRPLLVIPFAAVLI